LAVLQDISHGFALIVNLKKFGIFTIKNHFKISSEMDFRGIPVMPKYCYLGVTMNESDYL
jgi:hypothetical protein